MEYEALEKIVNKALAGQRKGSVARVRLTFSLDASQNVAYLRSMVDQIALVTKETRDALMRVIREGRWPSEDAKDRTYVVTLSFKSDADQVWFIRNLHRRLESVEVYRKK